MRFHREVGDQIPSDLFIVRRPAPGIAHPGIVPVAWTQETVVDLTGSVAAALGVTAVPFLALSDSSGTVHTVHLGLLPQARIADLLRTLGPEPGKGSPP
jgi:hypothetical protein